MLPRLVIAFLPRSKSLLISWLQPPSAVILKPPQIKSDTVSSVSLSIAYMWNQKKWYQSTYLQTRSWVTDVESKLVGVVLRWRRNRTGRPLSPPQIHQKNISTLSKFYKTTSECWQRTSGTQKSRSLSSKTGRKNIKDEKRDKGGREGAPPWEGSPVPGRES